ncbi:MAG: nucleotidyl transferase AbiEii/AbiGii toxin family protein, partial [Limisphaerales bacterium]
REKLDPVLKEIARKPPFLEFEEHVRRRDSLPARRHYKFYFKSAVDGNRLPILLDVLEEENPYGSLHPISLENPFFKLDHAIKVRVPTVDQLLGDKLTAFAPRTIGIVFNSEATTQIAKQLFDIGELFTVANDLTVARQTFDRICQDQIGYRGNKHTREEVLTDTFGASLALCRHGLAKDLPKDVEPCRMLEDGIAKMANYLIGARFGRDEAKIAASRAAFLCHLLLSGQCSAALQRKRFDPAKQAALSQVEIKWPQAALNKLLATTPEAFHYWAEIFKDLPGRKAGTEGKTK